VRKPLTFLGDSLDRIRDFPEAERQDMGRELARVQDGDDPLDWKPMTLIGPGVREIRVKGPSGAFRTIYVASKGDAIYVLHAFQKKTQKAPKRDIDLAIRRFKQI
jgi:phage-related protein